MLGRVVSAQDEFRGVLRDLVSPALRSAGLKGSGGRYQMPSQSCFALVGFQRSHWSTGSAVQFTVNLMVVSREVWNSGGHGLASRDACAEHSLPGRAMVGAHRQPHARWARSLVVAAAGPATGAVGC